MSFLSISDNSLPIWCLLEKYFSRITVRPTKEGTLNNYLGIVLDVISQYLVTFCILHSTNTPKNKTRTDSNKNMKLKQKHFLEKIQINQNEQTCSKKK